MGLSSIQIDRKREQRASNPDFPFGKSGLVLALRLKLFRVAQRKIEIQKPTENFLMEILGSKKALLLGVALLIQGPAVADGAKVRSQGKQHLRLSERSTVQFRVGILGVFKKSGQFPNMRGQIQVSQQQATVNVVIDVQSAQMAKASDTKLVLSEPYFNAKRFPEIRFESRKFSLDVLQNGGPIQGVITVRGVRHSQTLEITPDANCKEANKILCPFHAKGSLRRSDFGMTAKKAFVSDRVDLDLYCLATFD
jgi:polyisoprenoid-binding protein YceI